MVLVRWREGEYIQRLVFMMAKPNPNAKMKRVWIDSQTEEEILRGIREAKDIVEKMLPVLDNFERGLAMAEGSEDPFAQGMEKIYKQMITTLHDLGVKEIEAVGKEFDPNFHNAVMHVEDEEVGENIVVEEFQKGYTYKDFVVRHSMVKVAN